ncbi:MAG: hypothetical protein Q8N47_09200 [Bryobacterales bacterium]|nr:hypothetical protein [Bryobacterales bacterium]
MEPPALFPTRRAWLVAALAAPLQPGAREPRLVPRWKGDALLVSAADLHFLDGKPLERLKNGAPVSFDFQLSLLAVADRSNLRRTFERFTFSYDLWEEKFSVVRRGVMRQASRLGAEAAQAWCLENLAVPVAGLAPDRKFIVRLEVRLADSRDARPVLGEPGLSLTGLVEIFSRPSRGREPNWALETGPLRLDEIGGQTGGK